MTDDRWSRWLKDERWGDHQAPLEASLGIVRDRILSMADLHLGERVIDLGAGTGLLGLKAAEIVGVNGSVLFTDVSIAALHSALSSATTGCESFVTGDIVALPLRDAWADAVVIRSVIIYVRDRTSAAREIARVLRPGGRVALHEPINRHMQLGVETTGFEDIADAYNRAKELNPMTEFDESDLLESFDRAGFSSVQLRMDESRWPVNGKLWTHGFQYGAPAGYNAYDMLLKAGIGRERADEFLKFGNQQIGDNWRVMSCPVAYILAVR